MGAAISRHVVTLTGQWGTRQVHYRRAGRGPAVLLLHQSPTSSRDMLDLLAAWCDAFTLLAPDTPGYGQSDPLPAATAPLTIADLALATGEFADAIGLRRFGIYGYHTGASIGSWLAARWPERVTAVAAHGLCRLTTAERTRILAHYLPPLVPRWDGSHLAWLWARMREQVIFFPWYEKTADARLDLPLPPPERLQPGLLDFLRAGEHYATAYRAAFESDPALVLPGLRVPLLVTTGGGDPLAAHLQRLGTVSATTRVEHSSSAADALLRCHQHLAALPGDPAPAPPPTAPIAGRPWRRIIATADGEVHLWQRDGTGRPVMLVHGAGSSGDSLLRLLGAPGGSPVLLPDLPGHGESSAVAGSPLLAGAAQLGAVLERCGWQDPLLVGQQAGAAVLVSLAAQSAISSAALVLVDLPAVDGAARERWLAQGLPDLTPQWHGGHLLAAWHMLRDARLYAPWFERERASILHGEPDLDPERLQLELRALLQAEPAWRQLLAAALAAPLVAQLAAWRGPLVLAAAPSTGWHGPTGRAALALGCPALDLPADPGHWLTAVAAAAAADGRRPQRGQAGPPD
jgi:pimeloyl-ACP methyl ester carboxylesterase